MSELTDVQHLVGELESRQVVLTLAGDKIKVRAPSAPPPNLLDELRHNKPAVIEYLRKRDAQPSLGSSPYGHHGLTKCFHCRGSGRCSCLTCGEYRARMVWSPGVCVVCRVRQGRMVQ